MGNRLGVTTPAVNKWENNNTQPDIGLLAPIARLLGISTDTLLSFKDDLTNEEINLYVRELDKALDEKPYDEVFKSAKKKLEEYPSCKKLLWQTATVLDARRLVSGLSDEGDYEDAINGWYTRCLDVEDEAIRNAAAESLFNAYLRKKRYEKAEEYLSYLSNENPERRRLQALVYSKTGKKQEAYKGYEELLLTGYRRLVIVLNGMRILYMDDEDHTMAHKLVELEKALAIAFEMGTYHEVSAGLDVAVWEKDVVQTEQAMETLLESIETILDFSQSSLYQHTTFKKPDDTFATKLRDNLTSGFANKEAYGYMEDAKFWKSLVEHRAS